MKRFPLLLLMLVALLLAVNVAMHLAAWRQPRVLKERISNLERLVRDSSQRLTVQAERIAVLRDEVSRLSSLTGELSGTLSRLDAVESNLKGIESAAEKQTLSTPVVPNKTESDERTDPMD